MRRRWLLVAFVLLTAVLLWAAFPGISFDMFQDFEQCTNNAAPTNVCLANSSHGGGGSWSNASDGGNLLAKTASQCPLSGMGDAGTLGLHYSSATGAQGFEDWTLPAAKNPVSVGFCLFTGNLPLPAYNGCEMSHPMTFQNAGFGQLWRVADDSSGLDNHRELRLSPGNNNVTVLDATWYWVTMKFISSGTVSMNVYHITAGSVGTLLGSVTDTDTTASTVSDLEVGNFITASCALTIAEDIDDIIIDSTNATFPLLPAALGNGGVTMLGPGTKRGPTTTQ